MKKYLLLSIILLVFNRLCAQKIEISMQANSGLFHYAGNGATSASFINQGQSPNQDYTNNPYGNKNAASYGVGVQAQYVSNAGFIMGLQTSYEVLRSKVDITGYYPFYVFLAFANTFAPTYPIPAKGQAFLQNQAVDLSPYIGYRIKFENVSLDLLPGIDLDFGLRSYDKGKASATDPPSNQSAETYKTNFKRPNPPTDFRLRFGAVANYKRMAVTLSYAHGLTNYDKNMAGGNYNVHSELIRFGIAYKIVR